MEEVRWMMEEFLSLRSIWLTALDKLLNIKERLSKAWDGITPFRSQVLLSVNVGNLLA